MSESDLLTDSFKNTLINGNKEFLKSVDRHLLKDLATNGQKPKAIILCCSDSRVIPEYIFNAKIGDFFVIRVAGGVVDDVVMSSIEYGIEHLGISNIIMMGHTKCGAVQTTLSNKEKNNLLVEKIKPSVEIAKKYCEGCNFLTCCIKESVHGMFKEISNLNVFKSKNIKVYYILFDIDDGKISFFE